MALFQIMKPKIIGHRGCKGIEPENTLIGIEKAISLGVDAVEIDVHMSKDGKLVVIHDETVDGTTNGIGFVKEMKLEELKKLDAGKGERIPTLQEVVDLVKNKTSLIIELKVNGTEKKVVEIIEKNNLQNVIVISFIHQLIKNVNKINGKIKTGVLFVGNLIEPADAALKAGADYVFVHYKTIDRGFVDKCHKKGINVSVWNIDELEELKKYSKLGIDMIGSNKPNILVDYYKAV